MEFIWQEIYKHLGWEGGFAFLFVALTASAMSLLAQSRKDEIALWLMGAHTGESWAKAYLSMFDGLFGENHFNFRCFLRSSLVSAVTVIGIWMMMNANGGMTARLDLAGLEFWDVALIGVAVNLIADYLSLLETRTLLGVLPRLRNPVLHLLILIVDLIVSAAIILTVIWLVQRYEIFINQEANWLEVGLAFSVYTAPFYSTFVTSVWSWGFVLSSALLRLVKHLRLSDWLDVEGRPTLILSLLMGAMVFAGAHLVGFATERDATLDRAACTLFKGEICERLKDTTTSEEMQFLYTVNACQGA